MHSVSAIYLSGRTRLRLLHVVKALGELVLVELVVAVEIDIEVILAESALDVLGLEVLNTYSLGGRPPS